MNVILSCFLVFLQVGVSWQADCTSQAVVFNETFTHFVIKSDPRDLQSKLCTYTFTVPKYYLPQIFTDNIHLTGDNKITAEQYSRYGGSKTYTLTETAWLDLAPVNFTLSIALPSKTINDTFTILVNVKDGTPALTGQTFMVSTDLGEIIDSDNIQGNSSLVQQFDEQHPPNTFSIKIVVFSEDTVLYNLLQNLHVYDMGVYKGNLLDVLVAENTSQICSGSQFAIINTNVGSVGIFSILISAPYQWNGQVFVRPAPLLNATEIYKATNGLTVFHEIRNAFVGTITPSIYQKIAFRGDGVLQVYAGCINEPQESRRIATITPSNAAAYEQLMMFGRCRTYVLSQGVFQWSITNTYFSDNHHAIGRKGVIMSDTYPYTFNNNDTMRNYLIQAPENSKENIIVQYEVAYMAANTVFEIKQYISSNSDSVKSLTSTSGNYTSPSTYQQMIDYTVPKGSNGFLVRYTVTSSSGSLLSFVSFVFVSLIFVVRV